MQKKELPDYSKAYVSAIGNSYYFGKYTICLKTPEGNINHLNFPTEQMLKQKQQEPPATNDKKQLLYYELVVKPMLWPVKEYQEYVKPIIDYIIKEYDVIAVLDCPKSSFYNVYFNKKDEAEAALNYIRSHVAEAMLNNNVDKVQLIHKSLL